MSDPAAPPPGSLPWIFTSAAAIVVALWLALRSAVSSELRFVKGELAAEREAHKATREEAKAERARLEAEQAARRADNERSARALLMASAAPPGAQEWVESAPTGVRSYLGVVRPVDELLKRADALPIGQWSDSLPPPVPTRRRSR